MTSQAPSSQSEPLTGSARPIPPDALNGLTGAAYSDVIRREAAWTETLRFLEGAMDRRNAEIAALTGETLRLERVIGNMAETHRRSRATLAANDAENEALRVEVESLRAFQLQPRAKATNTPGHNDPEFGFDKTAALSEPDECCASGRCEVCSPGYNWGRDG